MDLTERLKARATDLEVGDLFHLLLAACSQCCQDHTGGNKTCPPPPTAMQAE